MVLGASALLAGGAALGWPWLVAVGVAPILLSVAPCAVMCALGLCMMHKSMNSPAVQNTVTDLAAVPADEGPRASATPEPVHKPDQVIST